MVCHIVCQFVIVFSVVWSRLKHQILSVVCGFRVSALLRSCSGCFVQLGCFWSQHRKHLAMLHINAHDPGSNTIKHNHKVSKVSKVFDFVFVLYLELLSCISLKCPKGFWRPKKRAEFLSFALSTWVDQLHMGRFSIHWGFSRQCSLRRLLPTSSSIFHPSKSSKGSRLWSSCQIVSSFLTLSSDFLSRYISQKEIKGLSQSLVWNM